MFLEHPAVYTAGRRTEPHERPFDGTPVIDVDRGGKITFHGPGQLVGYPITKLPSHVLVVDYVRRVEEALIRAVADLGVTTGRVTGRSGVWLPAGNGKIERKIAAIGIRVSRGVTMHGFSLNADVDLSYYERFVPCGIADAGVTSLTSELGRSVGGPGGRGCRAGRTSSSSWSGSRTRRLLTFQPIPIRSYRCWIWPLARRRRLAL